MYQVLKKWCLNESVNEWTEAFLLHLLDAPVTIQNELLLVPALWMDKGGRCFCFHPSTPHIIDSSLLPCLVPISAYNPVSSQLLGANTANSAAPSTHPWGKPFTLSPKRERELPSVTAQSQKPHNCISAQAAYQIFLFLGST